MTFFFLFFSGLLVNLRPIKEDRHSEQLGLSTQEGEEAAEVGLDPTITDSGIEDKMTPVSDASESVDHPVTKLNNGKCLFKADLRNFNNNNY